MNPQPQGDPPADSASPPVRHSRRRRLLLVALFGLVVLPLAYLIPANLWLATGAHDLANRRPEKFQADWSSAYSLWPGRIHFHDLELRGRNRRLMWSASLEVGVVELTLAELFTRQFHVEDLRGRGFRFRIRPRSDLPAGTTEEEKDDADDEADDEDPAATAAAPTRSSATPALPETSLPPIPGFDGLAEPRRSGKPPWTIEIDRFALDEVEEVWLERYRYQADAPSGRFTGALVLHLRRSVELPELSLELGAGALTVDERQLARLETGRVSGSLLPFLTRRYKLLEFSRFLKTEIELQATDSDLGALRYYLRGSPVELGGQGQLAARLFVDQGVLGNGSRLEVAAARLELAYLAYVGQGRGTVTLSVDPQHGKSVGLLQARLDDFELGIAGATAAHLRGRGLEVTAETENLDLAHPRPRLRGEIRLPATEIPDFRVYNSLWPKTFPLELESGMARLESRLRFDTTEEGHRADGSLAVWGEGIRARLVGNELVGDFRFEASLSSENLASRRFALHDSRLDLKNLSGDWQPETRGWWARITIPRGQLGLGDKETAEERSFDLELDAELADTSPLVAALLAKKPAFDWLSRLLTIDRLHLTSRVALQGSSLGLQLRLEGGGRLTVRGELELDNKKADGAFHIEYGPLSAAVRLYPDGDRDWKLLHSADTYDGWLLQLRRRRP